MRKRPGLEPVNRLTQSQLLEEKLRQLAVVVLPGVEQHLLDPGRLERG